jgi:hypothetical protein
MYLAKYFEIITIPFSRCENDGTISLNTKIQLCRKTKAVSIKILKAAYNFHSPGREHPVFIFNIFQNY